MIKHFRNDIIITVLLFISLVIAGILGYHYLQSYAWKNAIYLTLITITPIGFGDFSHIDDTDKLITILLILPSIIIYAYTIYILFKYVLTKNRTKKLTYNKKTKYVRKIKIICHTTTQIS